MLATDPAMPLDPALDVEALNDRLIQVLSSGIVAWIPVSELIQAAEVEDPESALDALASLNIAGWVELHEPDSGELLACLSPLAVECLGLSVIEQGGQVFWSATPATDIDWPRWHGSETEAEDSGDWIAQVADPRPGPAELVEAADWVDSQPPDPYPDLAPTRGRPEDLYQPRPSLILGINVPWFALTGLKHRTHRQKHPTGLTSLDQVLTSTVCPGCGGRPLTPNACCVYPGCDRWGRDPRNRADSTARIKRAR